MRQRVTCPKGCRCTWARWSSLASSGSLPSRGTPCGGKNQTPNPRADDTPEAMRTCVCVCVCASAENANVLGAGTHLRAALLGAKGNARGVQQVGHVVKVDGVPGNPFAQVLALRERECVRDPIVGAYVNVRVVSCVCEWQQPLPRYRVTRAQWQGGAAERTLGSLTFWRTSSMLWWPRVDFMVAWQCLEAKEEKAGGESRGGG